MKNRIFFLSLTFTLIFALTVHAQVQTPRYNSIDGNSGGYYEYLPQGYSSNTGQNYPLIVFIHGIGEEGNGVSDLPNLLNCWTALPRLIANGAFPTSFNSGGQNFSFIVISPQFRWWPSSSDVNDVVNYALQHYRVDSSRIYVTGLSMGGGAVWDFAGAYPTRAAAIVPVCGASYPSTTKAQAIATAKLPVWATQNQNDPIVSSFYTPTWVSYIIQAGGNAQSTIFPVSGHDAWTKTYDPNFKQNNLNIYEWMLQYKNGAAPNIAPVAHAGGNQTITLPTNSVTLNGSGTDADGSVVSYQWTKISGPSQFTIVSSTQAQTSVNNLVQGIYQFELMVTDNQGATGKDTMQVTVNAAPNIAPVAHAGGNQTITLPTNSVTLNGSGTDADGSVVSYQWTKISGPSQFTIVSSTQAQTSVNNLVQGIYQFELMVTDNQGATGKDTMQVTVNAAPNIAPVAHAGGNQTITLPTNSVTLNGSGTDADGSVVSYQWTKISGPSQFTIVSSTQAQTSVNNLVQGIYQFELMVTDNQGATGKDTMQVTVNAAPNIAPVAHAGGNQTITLPTNSVTLNGSGTDADGSVVSYQWTKISGPSQFTIVSSTQAQTSVNNLVQGIYQFELMVTDNQGATGKDTMQVTVNAAPNIAPVAHAGGNQTITLPTNSVTLNGSGTDADGSVVSYQWTKISGPSQFTIVSSTQAQTSVNNLVQGIYQFELMVTDNQGATGKDTMQVTVNAAPNIAPVAHAGGNQTITLPTNSVTLNGSGTDADGSVVSYQWTKISGPSQFTIVSSTQAQTSVNNLVQGIYQFELMVTDNQGATGKDTMQVTVNAAPNIAPVAHAGGNQTITLPTNSVTLNGSGTDADGSVVSYQWTKISGPSQFTIVSSTQAQTSVNNLVQGIYQFELMVTDNQGATGKDTMQVTVNAAPNIAPVAHAGGNQTITLPTNSVTLNGSGTDADGSVVSYQWTKISGPSQFTIVSSTQAQTSVNNLVQGIYQFELMVTDNQGATGKDTMQVTVNAAPNIAPVAHAGGNQTITLPTNSVTLNGSGTDADGSVVSYQWTKISGPSQFTIVSSTQAQTSVNNLVQGIYQFELMVTDNQGATGKDTMQVTVNAAPNIAPVAHAGGNQTITLPTNSVTLNGSGTDADGSVVSYQWTKISGPSQFTIVSSTQAQTSVNNLVQGIYQFELMVTDNQGATGKDTMQVTVNAAPNIAPVAHAGGNQTITLPTNSVTLNGSGTDADGSVVSYQWTKISGPSQFTIVSSTQAQTSVNNLVQGIYQFELMVTDNQGATGKDTMQVTVNAAPNIAPVAHAGGNIVLTLPQNFAGLNGSGTDADGSVVSYQWTKISGPSQFTIVSSTQAQTSVNNLVQGIYQFELMVTDNQGATGKDTMQVTVNAAPNIAPVAHAGGNIVLTLPQNFAGLNGSGTDADGSVVSYQWTKISGPSQFTIVSSTQAQTSVNNLVQGIYQFELMVTDNQGATGKDTMQVTVKPDTRTYSSALMYPNPATAVVNIKINAITHTNLTNIKIYNELGLVVYQEDFLRTQQIVVKQIDISKLNSGAYLIVLDVDINREMTLKFIKQ